MLNQRKAPDRTGVEDEDGGGPVKTFLEHLEDLRWMLIKCTLAIIVGMVVCFVAADRLVTVLTWPLQHTIHRAPKSSDVPVMLGTNELGTLSPAVLGFPTNATNATNATNLVTRLQLVPTVIGTNLIFTLVAESSPGLGGKSESPVWKNYTPLGGVMVALKLGIYGGLILSAPFLLYFIGQFVFPALKIKEKKILVQMVGFGAILFFVGVAFCYFVLAGVTMTATVGFSQWMGFGADEWRAEDYITFMCRFMLGMGLGFELPVVILTLVKIGLVDYHSLVRFRTYAIVGNLVIAGVITPSADPFTMFLMAFPMQLLYEISVAVAWYWRRKEQQQQLVEETA